MGDKVGAQGEFGECYGGGMGILIVGMAFDVGKSVIIVALCCWLCC